MQRTLLIACVQPGALKKKLCYAHGYALGLRCHGYQLTIFRTVIIRQFDQNIFVRVNDCFLKRHTAANQN